MLIRQLKLQNFRNYAELDFIPGPGINLLYGENAQGKTNILEAISMLATTRSLRAGRESELILGNCEMASVTAEIGREGEGDAEIQVSVFQTDKKTVRVNGMKRTRILDLLGAFNAVFFGSIDLNIVTGEPADRRHYLNVEISQISPRYVYDLAHYKRILEQRNRLLKDLRERPRPASESGLEAWNEQLVRFGSPLIEKRKFFLERLAPLADQIHRELTDGKEGLAVRYLPSIPLPQPEAPTVPTTVRELNSEDRYLASLKSETQSADQSESAATPSSANQTESALSVSDAIVQAFQRHLSAVAADEARRGMTLVGPQRDDIQFLIEGSEARIYGSQGQQRTVALAIKLAEFQLIEDYVGEPPVMLLDDVMSDLDDSRRKHLLSWVRRRCQIFITCTNLRSFPVDILREATKFQVVLGTVSEDPKVIDNEPEKGVEETHFEIQEAKISEMISEESYSVSVGIEVGISEENGKRAL